jgi:hypothetical protein
VSCDLADRMVARTSARWDFGDSSTARAAAASPVFVSPA